GLGVFWLLQGERDRGADEVECFALGAGWLGEHRDGGGGAGEADLVAGQGGQVGEQAAEASGGAAGRGVLGGGFALGGGGAAGATGRACWGGFWWVKVSGAKVLRRCQVR